MLRDLGACPVGSLAGFGFVPFVYHDYLALGLNSPSVYRNLAKLDHSFVVA